MDLLDEINRLFPRPEPIPDKPDRLAHDPDFKRLLAYVATGINRLHRLRNLVHALLRKVKDMSTQTDNLAARIAELEAAVAHNADGVKALTALHVDVSAQHADDSAAVDVLASRVEAITKVVLATNDAAKTATAAAHAVPVVDGDEGDTLAQHITEAGTEPAIDPVTGLPVAATAAVNEPV